jgi:hypothetical protein
MNELTSRQSESQSYLVSQQHAVIAYGQWIKRSTNSKAALRNRRDSTFFAI